MMANTPALFKQADITRALKGTVAAGLEPGSFEVEPDGKIIVLLKGEQRNHANSWDEVLSDEETS